MNIQKSLFSWVWFNLFTKTAFFTLLGNDGKTVGLLIWDFFSAFLLQNTLLKWSVFIRQSQNLITSLSFWVRNDPKTTQKSQKCDIYLTD